MNDKSPLQLSLFKSLLLATITASLPSANIAYSQTISSDSSLFNYPSKSTGLSRLKSSDLQLLKAVRQFQNKTLSPQNVVPLSLVQTAQATFNRNPQLLAAVETVRESGLSFVAAKNTWNPTLSFTSSTLPGFQYTTNYSHQNDTAQPTPDSISINRTGATTSDNSSVGLASIDSILRWSFLDFSRQPNINNYANQYDAQKYVLTSTARQILSNIQTLYVDLQAQKQLVDTYSKIVDSLSENVTFIKARQQIGLVSSLDVSQSESQLYNSITQLTDAIQGYRQISDRLAAIVSLPSQSLILPTDELSIDTPWDLSLDHSVQAALENNDNILQNLLLASASKWQGIYYLNQTLPRLSLSLSTSFSPSSTHKNVNTIQYGETYSVANNSSNERWSESTNIAAFLGFTWNIFEGGVNTSNAASQFSRSESYKYTVQNQRNQLTSDVRSNFSALESNTLSLRSADESVRSSYEAYRAAVARFSVGLANVTTINQTVQSYQSAVQARTSSIQRYNTALALLYKDTAIWPANLKQIALGFLSSHSY